VLPIACAFAFGYAGLVVTARAFTRKAIFPAPRGPRAEAEGAEQVTFRAADGVDVHALYFPPPSAAARTVVLFHGNGETIAHGEDRARALERRGLGALLVEYRGYGASEGEPSEEGLYLDAEAALDGLASRGVAGDRVALWGTSLGTGVALEMARRRAIGAIVLVTPYTSMLDVVWSHAPLFPPGLVVRDVFDSAAKCALVRAPALVVHGDRDEIVPFWMGQTIAGKIAGAQFHRVPGGMHNDLFLVDPTLIDTIAEHLARAR
jgi:uncharacterized protein